MTVATLFVDKTYLVVFSSTKWTHQFSLLKSKHNLDKIQSSLTSAFILQRI